jgi:hypothetical protein
VPNLKEPEEYSTAIKSSDSYFGYIAWAMKYMKSARVGSEKYEMGRTVLDELVDKNPLKPDAYIALWSIEYKVNRNYVEALNIAEQLFICATDYQSF